MTAGEFREVDHDLLADYLGGALDGAPEEATVARLVDEDPAWGRAYAELAPAVARVRGDLAGWGEPVPEMPLAVADRIAAALAGAGPAVPADALAGTGSGPALSSVSHLLPAQPAGGPRPPAAGSGTAQGRGTPTGPGRRGRRWVRFAVPVAVAAASLAAVGLGVSHLLADPARDGATSTTLSERADGRDSAPAGGRFSTSGAPVRSGTDYTPETLASASDRSALPRAAVSGPGFAPDGGSDRGRLQAGTGLDRLTDRAALDACLGGIAAEHGRGPVTVDLIDYAAFQGQPALVVGFVDLTGARWAWVSGPECGVPGSGADTRYRAQVR